MPDEIERKFLVASDSWKRSGRGTLYRQGYLSTDPDRTVRVRLEGEQAKLTIKGKKVGNTAPEFEYTIPVDHAQSLLEDLCIKPLIEKTRYKVKLRDGHTWEVDEFHGLNQGLVVAEIELRREGETFEKPDWLGEEVTRDYRYTNAKLAERPFSTWAKSAG